MLVTIREVGMAAAAAVGVASGIVTLTSATRHGPLFHTLSRRQKVGLGVLLLLAGGGAGVATMPPAPDRPVVVARVDSAAVVSTSGTTVTVTTETTATAPPPPPRMKPKPEPQFRIVDDNGASVDELTVAARAVLPGQSVDGHLRTAVGAPDANLQDLVTVTLTLNATIRDSGGNVTDAFELMTRGGGFTAEAATHQARERLKTAFIDRLRQEKP